jgi:hypothetical protein
VQGDKALYLMENGKDRAKIAAAKFFADIQSVEGN